MSGDMSGHAEFEALSAFVDGEAPEVGPHVAVCQSCQSTVHALRAVQTAVAEPVNEATPTPQARDRHLAAATGVDRGLQVPEARRRLPVRWLVPASIAAVFVLIAGAAAVLDRSGPSADRTTTAARAPESGRPAQVPLSGDAGGLAGSSDAGSTAASAATVGTSLGDIPDAATLRSRAGPSLPAVKGSPVDVAGQAARRGSASGVVGIRPCEEQARSREPDLGEVVYFATATSLGAPAYVLGFWTGPAQAPVTLLLRAQEGCGVLLRAAGP